MVLWRIKRQPESGLSYAVISHIRAVSASKPSDSTAHWLCIHRSSLLFSSLFFFFPSLRVSLSLILSPSFKNPADPVLIPSLTTGDILEHSHRYHSDMRSVQDTILPVISPNHLFPPFQFLMHFQCMCQLHTIMSIAERALHLLILTFTLNTVYKPCHDAFRNNQIIMQIQECNTSTY